MEIKLEDAREEDIVPMRQIVKDAWTKIYINADNGITREDLEAIDYFKPEEIERRKAELKKKDSVGVWVLKDEADKVVGFCKATKKDGVGEIKGMYVVEDLQGQGYGKKLMRQAFEWLGNMEIKLKVAAYNSQAIGFYKKMGFIESGPLAHYDGTELPSGKEIPRIIMTKPKIA